VGVKVIPPPDFMRRVACVILSCISMVIGVSCARGRHTGMEPRAYGECPPVRLEESSYPLLQYVTVVIDDHVAGARLRQQVRGPHSVVPIDTMPGLPAAAEIKDVSFPVGEEARRFEACSNVRVMRIRTHHGVKQL
jgi:hypothetical protein